MKKGRPAALERTLFPECVAKGSRFTLGVWVRRVRSTLLWCSQPSATVCNRPRATVVRVKWPCLWRVLQKRSLLEVSNVVWQAWHFVTFQNMFHNASKIVLRGRRNAFASFSEDELHFSWQAQHFGELHRHFSWQAQHFRRVTSRVLRIALSGLREVVRRCKFRGRRGIL